MEDFRITFWGTRGSMPVSGRRYREFGGNTICIEVAIGGRRFVVDCGSGAVGLGRDILRRGGARANFLFTHLHLDHVIGLTGFQPLYRDDFSCALRAARRSDIAIAPSLARLFDEPLSPVGFGALPARVDLATFASGETLSLDGVTVRTAALRHGPGTVGYRFEHGGRSFVVLTDHEHDGAPEPGLVDFCAGADAIAYDAMWCADDDYDAHRGWGHSTWQAGLALTRAARARRLICIHHAPDADDAVLAGREARLKAEAPDSLFARDDHVLAL